MIGMGMPISQSNMPFIFTSGGCPAPTVETEHQFRPPVLIGRASATI